MPNLDYSKLKHGKKSPVNSRKREESFYMQKGNGREGSYRGPYRGDFSVFRDTRSQFNQKLAYNPSLAQQDDIITPLNEEDDNRNGNRIDNSDIDR